MHYVIKNGEDAGAPVVHRRSAKSAWLAVRELQRKNIIDIVILDHDGRPITPEVLAGRAAEERGE